MADREENLARVLVAAGALFVDDDHVLLVRKTYGNRWDIPGGFVDHAESPAAACRRELAEEIGLERRPARVLASDWVAEPGNGGKLLYIFDCGPLGADERRITLDGEELDHWEWVPVDALVHYLIPGLLRRVTRAYEAHRTGATLYLEHGVPTLGG